MKFKWAPKPKPNKYGAQPQIVDGVRCASKLEAAYYRQLVQRRLAGDIAFFLFQIPLLLEGGVRYFVDFVVFGSDGTIEFIDTKGKDTPISILKRKQVEARYPIQIKVVRSV